MWYFISEHWLISTIGYVAVVLFIARFYGFNDLPKG